MKLNDFNRKKQAGEKITLVTCYDYTSARFVSQSDVDAVLVGDTAAMIMHGHSSTTQANMDMMVWHTQAVARGMQKQFIIGDLPFFSYRKSLCCTMDNVQRLVQAGAQAVKLEGADGNIATVRHIVESGVPVMGHLGLTPQSIHALGGHKVQGKSKAAEKAIFEQACALEQAGCFALVLECVPSALAQQITQTLKIATIGIGAGSSTNGQILVLQDLLGLQTEFKPKFLKHYLNGADLHIQAINQYVDEVRRREYPTPDHCY